MALSKKIYKLKVNTYVKWNLPKLSIFPFGMIHYLKKIINERTMRDCRRGYLQNLFISTATCLMRPIEGLKQSHFHNKFVFQY